MQESVYVMAVAGSSGWDPGNPPLDNGTVPRWMNNRNFGQLNVLLLEGDDGKKLNPFWVGKSLEVQIGDIEGATTEADGLKYVLRVRNADQVKKLLAMKQLHNGVAVSVMLHPTLNKRRCVFSCREVVEFSEAELVEELRPQGVVGAKRFTRMMDGKIINTPTVALTIEGTEIPEYIKVGPLRIKTRVYVPEPTICFTCYQYGHTKARCKAAARCRNCSNVHDLGECKEKPYCLNCQGQHGPSNRKCPVYMAEKEISRIRVTKGINYSEACKQFKSGAGSYAEVSKVQQRLNVNESNAVAGLLKEKDDIIKQLMDTVAQLSSRVEELERKKKEKKHAKQHNREQQKLTMEDTDMETDSSQHAAETGKVSDTSSKAIVQSVQSSKFTHKRHYTTEITPPSVKKPQEEIVDSLPIPINSGNPLFKHPNNGQHFHPKR